MEIVINLIKRIHSKYLTKDDSLAKWLQFKKGKLQKREEKNRLCHRKLEIENDNELFVRKKRNKKLCLC